MKHLSKLRALMLVPFLLLGTIPAAAVERPFALNGTGVATLVTDDAGHLIGAIPTGGFELTLVGKINY
jgi:hypothetical protein